MGALAGSPAGMPPATPGVRRAGLASSRLLIWLTGGLAAVVLGAIVSVNPLLLLFAAAAAGVGAVFIAAFAEPRWVLLAQIFLVLSYAPPVLSANFGIPITLQSLTFLLLFGTIVRFLLGAERLRPPREAWALAALLGAMLISLPFAADRARAALEISDFVSVGLLALLILALVDDPVWYRRALWAFVAGVGFLAALATIQQVTKTFSFTYFGFATIAEGDRDLARSAGPTDANFFAQLLVVTVALSVYLGFASRRLSVRLLAGAIALTSAAAVLYTYSRGALLAAAVAFVAAALLRKVRISVLVAIGAALVLVAAFTLPPEAKDRFLQIVRPGSSGIAHSADSSVANRFAENLAAIHMLEDYPLLGVGPGNYSARYRAYSQEIGLDTRAEERPGVEQAAHSLYLETLSELGALGAGVLFAIIGLALRGALRARSRLVGGDRMVAEGVFVALIGYFTAAIFLHGAYPHFLWVVLALGLVGGRLARDSAERTA
jgi:putative inorganic carbon (hco3(-)) transporter